MSQGVCWRKGIFKSGWALSGEKEKTYLFSWYYLYRMPRSLRALTSEGVKQRFSKLLSNNPQFIAWWNQSISGGPTSAQRFFLLNFPKGAWEYPWELLIESARETAIERQVSIIRTTGLETPFAPSSFDGPMKILVLQGGDRPGGKLDLSGEASALMEIWSEWSACSFGSENCISRPECAPARKKDMSLQIQLAKPSILWFSGHGDSARQTSLTFANGELVSATEFANLVKESGVIPHYCVFWACETGSQTKRGARFSFSSPELYEALGQIGVYGVLAVQAPIRDCSAKQMASELFTELSKGKSIESAIASCRAKMLNSPPADSHPLDWAAPVVWISGKAKSKLNWSNEQSGVTVFHALGRMSFNSKVRSEQSEISRPTQAEIEKARNWLEKKFVTISASSEASEHRVQFRRILNAIQAVSNWFVIYLEIDSNSIENSVATWAESLASQLTRDDCPVEVVRALNSVASNASQGWGSFCETLNTNFRFVVGLTLFGVAGKKIVLPRWFSDPLNRDECKTVALTSEAIDGLDVDLNDQFSDLLYDISDDDFERLFARAPRLARAMAVLEFKLRTNELKIPQTEWTFVAWNPPSEVCVGDPGLPQLAYSVKCRVLELTSQPERKQAHLDCISMLRASGRPRDERLLRCELDHYMSVLNDDYK